MPRAAGTADISSAAEDKLSFKLGLAAGVKCADLIAAYNACVGGRTVSVAWACRNAYRASQECIREYVNQDNLEVMKQRWIAAGKPRYPDWNQLMDGIVASEHRQQRHQQQQLQQQQGQQ
eukprot:GHRR01012149.1.p2 GENE.GHRR01012149.1~~GHRR01012149.1.p2  ORF type:complete len:120 (+),score=41.28 GHRR01012149.1:471-830(+)